MGLSNGGGVGLSNGGGVGWEEESALTQEVVYYKLHKAHTTVVHVVDIFQGTRVYVHRIVTKHHAHNSEKQ